MWLMNKIFGRPLATSERSKQALNVYTGVPALGLDALASIAYGPEALLIILLPLGLLGLHYFPYIILAIIFVLLTIYLSYMQTIAAYPNGGGAYIVASDNLGKKAGIWAAVALLIDYLLNVAVGISAGIGTLVSAFPALQPYTLPLCLFILFMLTVINLRGVRESGLFFIMPVILFIVCLATTVVLGVVNSALSNGVPHTVIAPPVVPAATTTYLSTWLIVGAFANGLTAMTGIEAVSNAIPLFRQPVVTNARWTMSIIVLLLAFFLLALAFLCPTYHITAMDQRHPGYQLLLSQLIAAVSGRGIFYYISMFSIFMVLTYSAQTSFVAFPRVCRLLAEDEFLPHFFANRGRRLVFTPGIIFLVFFSAILLIIFGGITYQLIPLFAVGAFSAFTFSQTGMVFYWLRKKGKMVKVKLAINILGAVTTGLALVIIIIAKFFDGAWITLLLAAMFFLLFTKIHKHYQHVSREINNPLALQVAKLQPPVVVIPIDGWTRVTEKAVRFGLLLSDDVTAVYVKTESDNSSSEELKKLWQEKVIKPAKESNAVLPTLKIINSPYRRIYAPILKYVNEVKNEKKDRLIAVIISELVEPHWYEYLLHNAHGAGLRALLFMEGDQRTIVISTPWYLHDINS